MIYTYKLIYCHYPFLGKDIFKTIQIGNFNNYTINTYLFQITGCQGEKLGRYDIEGDSIYICIQ